MMRAISRITAALSLGAALACSWSGTASAQTADEPSDSLALEALHNFAVCAVNRTSAGAEKMLAADPSSPDAYKARMQFAKGHGMCVTRGNKLKFGGLPFSGDIAEALIAAKYRAAPLATAARSEVAPRNMVEAIGMCVVKARPADVAAVFATEPASKEELAALKPTGDILPGCVPAGQTIKMNRPAVRAIYALGAYRLLAGNPELPEG